MHAATARAATLHASRTGTRLVPWGARPTTTTYHARCMLHTLTVPFLPSVPLQSFFSGKTVQLDEVLTYNRYAAVATPASDIAEKEAKKAAKKAKRREEKASGEGDDVRKKKEGAKRVKEAGAAGEADPVTASAEPGGTTQATQAAQSTDASGTTKKRKARWSEERKAAARLERVDQAVEDAKKEASAPGAKGQRERQAEPQQQVKQEEKKKKKKEKNKKLLPTMRKLTKEERVSGPGNADEAQEMRARLGFVGEGVAEEGGFSFGFGNVVLGKEETEETEEMEEMEQKQERGGDRDGSSSDSSSSSDSDSESGDSDTSSDSSESERDDSEPAAVAAPLPQSQLQPQPVHVPSGLEFMPRRVFVGGMPFGYTEGMIREYWEYCGPIESLDIMTFPDTGRFKGIAFITFATDEAYESALSFNGTECDGQILKVQKCKADKKRYSSNGATGGGPVLANQPASTPTLAAPAEVNNATTHAATTTLSPNSHDRSTSNAHHASKVPGYNVAYVGNIAFEASPDEIKALFEPYGVTKVRLHTDKDTGKPKGYAHVHFKDAESLDKAVAINGTNFFGRNLRIGYAQQKKT